MPLVEDGRGGDSNELPTIQKKLAKLESYFAQTGESLDLSVMLKTVLDRVEAETGVNDSLQGIAKMSWLSDWSAIFDNKGIQHNEDLPEHAFAYCDDKGVINIKNPDHYSDPAVMLAILAEQGMPVSFSAVFHELIHRLQVQSGKPADFKKIASFIAVLGTILSICLYFQKEKIGSNAALITLVMTAISTMLTIYRNHRRPYNQVILAETQAYGATMSISNAIMDKDGMAAAIKNDTHRRFFHVPFDQAGMDDVWFKNTVAKIFDQIQQLRALGASHKEIAAMVWKGESEELDNGAPLLAQEIVKRKTALGIDNEQLAQRVLDLEQGEYAIQEAVRRITREEIDKVYSTAPVQAFVRQLSQGGNVEKTGIKGRGPSAKRREELRKKRK